MQQIIDANNINANNIDLGTIQGRDLKALRLDAQISCAAIALELRVKSPKTIENWSNGKSVPRTNVFIHYCKFLGFDAAKVVHEVLTRNCLDHTKQQKINLNACRLKPQR